MKQKTKKRAIREVSAALLNSQMSDEELKDFCHSILKKENIINEIAESILKIIDQDDIPNIKKKKESESESELNIFAEEAAIYLRANRVSKDRIIEAMVLENRSLGLFIKRKNLTIIAALKIFFKHTQREKWEHFIYSLTNDDYLRIIMGDKNE